MKNNEAEKKPKNFKKFKYGSMSVAVIVLVVAIVVVINVIIGVLMNRYPIKVDLTADKRYELCDETIEALKNLDKDVEIAVMYPKESLLSINFYQMIPKILENYEVYAKEGKGSIEVKYVDTTKDPDVVSRYSKYYNGTITDGNIVIYSNEKVKVTHISTMFTTGKTSSYQQQDDTINFIGESTITSAILSVTDANPINVAFASYSNKAYVYGKDTSAYYSTEQFKSLLAANGYEFTDIDVMTDEISTEDYDMIVIPAPTSDFSEDVIAKLEDFLYNDGNYQKNLIFIANANAAELPNLDEFLAKWNIQIGDAYVFDNESTINATVESLGAVVSSPIVTVSDTEAVGELPNEALPIIAPLSKTVNILDKNTDYKTSAVLASSASTYLKKIDGTDAEGQGPRNVMVLSKRERAEGFDVYESNVLAIGSAFMSDPSIILNTNAYNNANVLLNTVNTLTGKESSAVIPQKNLQRATLALTAAQNKGIMIFVIFVIPLIVVAVGVTVFIRRRNR